MTLDPGTRLGPHEIIALLGSGGMGEVYRARDTKLKREVAIKVLPPDTAADPERRKRLLREAVAVAALKHPNIVTIYSVEEDGDAVFLVMELVAGRTLAAAIPSTGLSLERLLEIAIPLSDAVSYAHTKGITHRDLKPANIMFDEGDRVKVLDFGLAKLLEPATTPESATMPGTATEAGRVMGTAPYMSPEQAEGKPVDARTDIFSLGVILYEMATGHRPFKGDTTISTISSILKDEPTPVNELNRKLPRHLARITSRCLAKDPARRYQVAADLQNELAGLKEESSMTGMERPTPISSGPSRRPLVLGLGAVAVMTVILGIWQPWSGQPTERAGTTPPTPASPETARKMIVVLPFANLGLPEDAYFAAGVTEELVNRLTLAGELGVISRTSAMRYADSKKTLQEIGDELGVDYVVEGTVRWQKRGDGTDRVRVNPRLVRVADGTNVWSSQYDQELENIFDIQTTIATEIVDQLGVALALSGSHTAPPTRNMEAYQAYLKGVELLWTPGSSTLTGRGDEAERFLREAVEKDPDFVLAWTRLSMNHSGMYHAYVDHSEARLVLAREAVDRAMEIAPDHPEVKVALGYYYYWGLKDYERALEAFATLGDQIENNVDALMAVGFILRRQGKMEEALANLKEAALLDPQNGELARELGYTLTFVRRLEDADRAYERLAAIRPDAVEVSLIMRGWAHIQLRGDAETALRLAGSSPSHEDPSWGACRVYWTAEGGEYEEALKLLDEETEYLMYEDASSYLTKPYFGAVISSLTDNHERTRGFADSARIYYEDLVRKSPSDPRLRGALGTMYGVLGRNQEAVREGKLGADLIPVSRDHIRGYRALFNLACIYAVVGDVDAAVETMEYLVSIPTPQTRANFAVDPHTRRLRGNPRFDAFIEGTP